MIDKDMLERAIITSDKNKTSLDKVHARSDIDQMRAIIKKPHFAREDFAELLNLIPSAEAKLLNYSAYDRYGMNKFYVWVREFFLIAEQLFDYKEHLEAKENFCENCKLLIKSQNEKKKCKCSDPKPLLILTPLSRQLFENCLYQIEHDIKFMVDLYMNLARTTLSVGATGFLESLKSKFEMSYPEQRMQSMEPPEKRNPMKFWG